ncbi:MAG: MerR family transcriptional regulator [Myxococcota bacterium]|jgi:DNA-binding transcriptional MerR regulator|nr:MerR family transcriptional regulator [Myxococcota bacterium]
MTGRIELPDKLFFKIGEVSRLLDVRPHVLRYWESEFPSIRPQKSKTNQRLYRRRDVEALIAISHLLYDRKFTIEGAKRFLAEQGTQAALPPLDPEAVAAQARAQAMAELDGSLLRQRAEMRRQFEKDLLGLRQKVVAFLRRFE